jgi:hypothetical protein
LPHLAELIGAVRWSIDERAAPYFVNKHTNTAERSVSSLAPSTSFRPPMAPVEPEPEPEPEPEQRASLWARLTIGVGLLLTVVWSGLLLWEIVSLLQKLI